MHIQVLYFKGCPNYLAAIGNLNAALHALSMSKSTTVEPREIKTQAEAEAKHFIGSPTFIIEGLDMFGEPSSLTYGLRCRTYVLDGRMVSVPTQADFAEHLRVLTKRPRPQSKPR
ncbi:MAG: thioredoxin family protein [Parcubacteria group bacterium]